MKASFLFNLISNEQVKYCTIGFYYESEYIYDYESFIMKFHEQEKTITLLNQINLNDQITNFIETFENSKQCSLQIILVNENLIKEYLELVWRKYMTRSSFKYLIFIPDNLTSSELVEKIPNIKDFESLTMIQESKDQVFDCYSFCPSCSSFDRLYTKHFKTWTKGNNLIQITIIIFKIWSNNF